MRFRGFIDEVYMENRKPVIRDYKSGSPWLGEMKIHHDPQLTFYNIGLCARCFNDEKFAKSLGLENMRHQFMGNPLYIHPEIRQEFFMIEALPKIEEAKNLELKGEKIDFSVPKLILPTKRQDEHFFELVEMINGAEEAVRSGDVYPERGRKCDICDMKKACASKLEQVSNPCKTDKRGNYFFAFMKPPYAGPVDVEPKEFDLHPPKKQKKFDYRRKDPGIGRF